MSIVVAPRLVVVADVTDADTNSDVPAVTTTFHGAAGQADSDQQRQRGESGTRTSP
jgi:hypothetical protein